MIDRVWVRQSGWLAGMIVLTGVVGMAVNADVPDRSDRSVGSVGVGSVGSDGSDAPGPRKLPWRRSATGGSDPAAKRLSSPREMLELFNVGESELQQLADGRPLVADEEETLWKILFNMPRFGLDKLHAWRREGVAWQEIAADPAQYRVEIFGVKGRIRGVRRVELPPESAARLELTHFYEAEFDLDDAPNPATVYSREIPAAWEQTTELDERAACLGLFLKSGSSDEAEIPLIFAAERIAWLPDQPRPQWGIGRDEVLLGDLGVDVGLLEGVRQTNGRALTADDREVFYQMLAATGRADQEALVQQASRDFDLGTLLNQPAKLQGRLLAFYARARRVQKIVIDDADIRERFGIGHYYQIDLQVPLDDQEVRLVTRPGETDGPVFRNFYPAHCNVLQLPAGMPDQPDVDHELLVAGWYFKLWAYRTDYVQAFGQEKRQLGPLFLAVTPRVIERRRDSNPLWGWIGGAVFLALLAGMAGAGWIFSRGDRRIQERMRARRSPGEAEPSFDQLRPLVQDQPDFSHLEQDRDDSP
jgi:hypothetical protein